jgi:hypothetical protein
MNDAAVVPRLVGGKSLLLLEDDHGDVRPSTQHGKRGRQADDPASDDDYIDIRECHAAGTIVKGRCRTNTALFVPSRAQG